jgi:hypothetical protein
MTDQLPGRTPPWAMGVWAYPARPSAPTPARREPAEPTEPVRIGDAERDEALTTLGEHFAAGRLNREEFDERAEQAMAARFDSDLAVLFKDLPKPPREQQAQQVPARRQRPAASPAVSVLVLTLVPLLILAVTASIALHGPVLVAPLIWLLVLSGMGRRHFHR